MMIKQHCLVSQPDNVIIFMSHADNVIIFMSHADIYRSNGPENKLTYHAHVLISLYGEYTGTYLARYG